MAVAAPAGWEPLPLPGFDFGDRTPEQRTITERFWRFNQDHPEIYRLLRRFAFEAKDAGRERIGIGALWERLRWYVAVETRDDRGFKLNNDFRSRYSRLLQRLEPELAGLFETRRLRSDGFDVEGAA